MKYVIRRMQLKDIEQVAAIEKSTFAMPWSENSFINACADENNVYLVCVIQEEVAGYAGMWTSFDEANITNVAVAKEHRERGYGRLLLEELEKCGLQKGVNTFFLEARESNFIARTLYERLGYQKIGNRKNFYEKPVENAIVMSKTCGI